MSDKIEDKYVHFAYFHSNTWVLDKCEKKQQKQLPDAFKKELRAYVEEN